MDEDAENEEDEDERETADEAAEDECGQAGSGTVP